MSRMCTKTSYAHNTYRVNTASLFYVDDVRGLGVIVDLLTFLQ